MDARARRSRTALVDAVYRLASERDIDDITIADVATASGVSRDTFYRHAADPVDLLATALHAELAESLAGYHAMPVDGDGSESVFAAPARILLSHVAEHAAIYRRAPAGRLSGRLLSVLIEASTAIIGTHLRRHPEIAPPDVRFDDETVFSMTVAYAAGGTVAAVTAWLQAGMPQGIDEAVRVLLAAAPRWWLGSDERRTAPPAPQ
jgi:AcrR family transcriptional regulator